MTKTLLVSLICTLSSLTAFASATTPSARDAVKATITEEIGKVQMLIGFVSDAEKNCNFQTVYNSPLAPDQVASDLPLELSTLQFSLRDGENMPAGAAAKEKALESDLPDTTGARLHEAVYSVQGCQSLVPAFQKLAGDLTALLASFN